MESLIILFPESGVRTWVFLPPLVALVVSFFTSMAGVSGAFVLLPFQMSVLGFTSPSVTATNLLFNVVAVPSGIYRYFKEGRLAWPLASVFALGTLPGVFAGYYLRVLWLPDPRAFKLFVGVVLLAIGARLLRETAGSIRAAGAGRREIDRLLAARAPVRREPAVASAAAGGSPQAVVRMVAFDARAIEYEFWGERFRVSVPRLFLLALAVGAVGGAYGIGGGAIIAPFCVAVFGLPVYTVAGPALVGTFATSVVGVLFYSVLPGALGASTAPDWRLGLSFGVGGVAGMYLGARLQRFVPQRAIKLMLGLLIALLALKYVAQFFA